MHPHPVAKAATLPMRRQGEPPVRHNLASALGHVVILPRRCGSRHTPMTTFHNDTQRHPVHPVRPLSFDLVVTSQSSIRGNSRACRSVFDPFARTTAAYLSLVDVVQVLATRVCPLPSSSPLGNLINDWLIWRTHHGHYHRL